MTARFRARVSSAAGQGIVEFAIILPLVLVVLLGVIELSYALLDQHVVTKLTREGSNLISRDASLLDAATALSSMATAPVNFGSSSSKVIFSVVKCVGTTGAANYNKDILYQRYAYGGLSAASQLTTAGGGSFGPAPDFIANNSDNDTSLQLVGFQANLLTTGGMLYVTEIYTTHNLITPFNNFGFTVPNTLYSIAYF